jgi:hypothetical protein
MTVPRTKKEKEFWQAMYSWKTTTWPNGLSPDDWRTVRREDLAAYDAKEYFDLTVDLTFFAILKSPSMKQHVFRLTVAFPSV